MCDPTLTGRQGFNGGGGQNHISHMTLVNGEVLVFYVGAMKRNLEFGLAVLRENLGDYIYLANLVH